MKQILSVIFVPALLGSYKALEVSLYITGVHFNVLTLVSECFSWIGLQLEDCKAQKSRFLSFLSLAAPLLAPPPPLVSLVKNIK